MVLHFISEKKFGTGFINLINRHYDAKDHQFVVFGHERYELDSDQNVCYVTKKTFFMKIPKILSFMKKADLIIVHFLTKPELLFFDACCKRFLPKMVWAMWGGDLYEKITKKYYYKLKLYFVKKIKAVGYIIKEDYDYLSEHYVKGKKSYQIHYTMGVDTDRYISIIQQGVASNESHATNVVIGNSATPENHHEELFRLLEGKKIDVYCPLSYGSDEYRQQIIELGQQIFGEHFHPLTDFLEYGEYLRFLCKMDIGIYGYERQQGLGNVTWMLQIGKTVYIRKDSPLWSHYYDTYPKQVFDLHELKTDEDEVAFVRFPVDYDAIKKKLDVQDKLAVWQKVFESE